MKHKKSTKIIILTALVFVVLYICNVPSINIVSDEPETSDIIINYVFSDSIFSFTHA